MKWIWILTYYNLKGFEVQTFYFSSEEKAQIFAVEKNMPKSAVRFDIFPASID